MSPGFALNPEQEMAVSSTARFVLVSAGAGTGKTLTLTRRIVHLLKDRGVPPHLIWAVTFTNRAALEMRQRVQEELGGEAQCPPIWVGTIHALCAQLIRRHCLRAGLSSFTIADQEYQREIVAALKELWSPRFDQVKAEPFLEFLSRGKNGLPVEECPPLWEDFRRIYQEYLASRKVLDYDDLILRVLDLLGREQVAAQIGKEFGHLLVDEYQDINPLQYRLIKALVGQGGSLFAIGDADQCIYGFRGALVQNFLDFSRDYPGAVTINLHTNYRCDPGILSAAQELVAHNRQRLPVRLRAQRQGGRRVKVVSLKDERAEAHYVVGQIERLLGGNPALGLSRSQEWDQPEEDLYHFSDILVAYRTHALSREIKAALNAAGLPLSEPAADPLREDPLVKSIIALARLIWNQDDDRALVQAMDTPGRPGSNVVQALRRAALEQGSSLWHAARSGFIAQWDPRLQQRLEGWMAMVEDLRARMQRQHLEAFLNHLVERLRPDLQVQSLQAHHPWLHLLNLCQQYEDLSAEEALPLFLDRVCLYNPSERRDPRAHTITLLTLHGAKGLEFPVVFLVGAEKGLVPYEKEGQLVDIEEERRLFYVGMTRAKERLYITHCRTRFIYGKRLSCQPSPFIQEIGDRYLEREAIEPKKRPPRNKQMSLW